jgi:hypothetical protein
MFFSEEQLGPRQALLPSGGLLCQGVVVGRTGEQLYRPHEIGAEGDAADADGMIRVQRDASEVFHPTGDLQRGCSCARPARPWRNQETSVRGPE